MIATTARIIVIIIPIPINIGAAINKIIGIKAIITNATINPIMNLNMFCI